jgi:hypothetical protein
MRKLVIALLILFALFTLINALGASTRYHPSSQPIPAAMSSSQAGR